jgi:hypothetical protein
MDTTTERGEEMADTILYRTAEVRTENGWYREEFKYGITARLYCGDCDEGWVELTGDPDQADIEQEISEALNNGKG